MRNGEGKQARLQAPWKGRGLLNSRLARMGIIALLPILASYAIQVQAYELPNLVVVEEPYVYIEEEESPVLEADVAVAEALYKEWQIEQAKAQTIQKKSNKYKKQAQNYTNYCSCVLYAKSQTGFTQSVGNARNWPKNSKTPMVGGVVVTNESRAGHVAIITKIEDSLLFIQEANYSRCKLSSRTINVRDPRIIGFWKG